ncbi:MAG: glycosyltransferase [Nitrospira sp.]|nr:MAG: glycosyltransferase [Nitrospira sp.]
MKILFFAPDAMRPNGEGSYAHHNIRAGLLQLGHEIIDFDYRGAMQSFGQEGTTQQVKKLLTRTRPDLFFHMHYMDELSPELASYITEETDVVLAVFFSDDDWRLSDSLKIAGQYHAVVTTCREAVDRYREHGITQVLYAPYACNPDLYHPLEGLKKYDVTFVGQGYRGRPELVQWLKEQGVNIQVWGQGWEEHPALRDIAGGFLPHQAMIEVFAQSKIVLGMSWVSGDGVTLQIKGRTFEYAACRAFQLTTYDERLKLLFRDGDEIVFYRDREELLKKIRHYLVHPEEREHIAQAAYLRALGDHTWTQRLKQILGEIIQFQRVRGDAFQYSMGSATPSVAVITYVYNGARYIEELIQSVLTQTYQDFEFLILDDGSTDDTRDIVSRYLHEHRIRYVYQENIGRNLDAFHELINRSVALTSAPYVCFAGADDVFLPDKLAMQVAAFSGNSELDIVFSDGYHIDADGRPLGSDFGFTESKTFTARSLLRTLFKKNIIAHPTVMMTRQSIIAMGGFEGGYATDPHFWLKSAPFLRFRYLDRKLIKYRIHEQGASTSSRNRTVPETVALLTKMRKRYTIADLYPEIADCADKGAALYSAYLHFGNVLFTANIPVPALAVLEYACALEHRPGGVEAMNNAAVALWLMGIHDKSLRLWASLEERVSTSTQVAHNLSVVKQLQRGLQRVQDGFILLSESSQENELLRHLDPPNDLAADHRQAGWPLLGIQRFQGDRAQQKLPVSSCEANRERPEGAPLVSVIMPTHNRPQQLQRAVASVLAQTYQDFEVIVINDAGCEVESALAGLNAAGRVTYVRHAVNRGLSAARNTGLKLARGKYVAYLDDDDRYLPDHLETLVSFLKTHHERAVYTDAWRVHEQRQGDQYIETKRDVPYSYEFDAARLLISNYFPVLTVMHERACLEVTGLFDESLTSHEDWDLWIRISRRYPFKHLKRVTAEFTWRTDGSSMTSSRRPDFLRTAAIIYDKYRSDSEAIPGVREAQKCILQEFQANLVGTPVMTCSIIIPTWNKVELTRQCLTALAAATTDVSFEVIIVDNGSTDGTREFLSELKGDVQIILNDQNLGFAKACNQGARAARGKYLVFLNNDTIPQSQWLNPLVSEVDEHSDVGIVGSKLLFADGSIQHAGVVFMRSIMSPYHIYRSVPGSKPGVNQRCAFQAVTAACMLIRQELFEEVQGFDEAFINGFEDVDLCLKVREKGYQVIYQPRSVVYHLESQTPGRKEHDEQNSQLLLERWGTHWWLGDEDLHYYQNGFKLVRGSQDVKFATQLEPMTDIYDRASWAHIAAAQTAALKKDWAAVKRELRMVENWPNDQFVLSWGAMVAERLQEPISRTKFLSRYVALVDAPVERIALIRALLEQKDLVGAEEQLRILLASSPNHAEGLLLRGILHMQREQYEPAETAFGSAMREGADRKKCLMGMGMAAMGRAYTQGAWEHFLHVLEEYPDDAEAIHWLVRAGTAQNRWDELSRHLCKYLVRNPADLAIRFALAGALVRGEQIEAASLEYETLRALAPTFDGLNELGQAIARKQAVSTMEAAHS